MSFPRYPEYKDSGVEWLGEVPGHWDVQPFKHQVDRNDGGVWGDDPDGIDDTFVLRSTEQTVDGRWKLDDPAPRKLSDSEIRGSLLAENDLLLTKSSGSSLHIGKTTLVNAEIAEMRCCYSNFMQRIRMRPTFLPKLAWYVMNNDLARLQFDLLSNSSTGLANLNATMVGQILVPVPPLPEQTQIAAFLDQETAKIDALVAEQHRLIALLKEKRQAVISHAVTRGLNPDAPMKPSGIEWLGDVPEHWALTKIKRLVSTFEQGWSPQCEGFPVETEQEWGVLKVGCVNGGTFRPEENKTLPSELDPIPSLGIAMGDLLISRANTRELVGGAAVAKKAYANLLLCDKLYRLRFTPGVCYSAFVALYLGTEMARGQIELAATGASSSMVNISQSTILELDLALPELQEQKSIVTFLEAESAKFDTLTIEAQRAIDLLQERRTALISAAVTGQIDVRGEAVIPATDAAFA